MPGSDCILVKQCAVKSCVALCECRVFSRHFDAVNSQTDSVCLQTRQIDWQCEKPKVNGGGEDV